MKWLGDGQPVMITVGAWVDVGDGHSAVTGRHKFKRHADPTCLPLWKLL